jgi:hypothetical protein
MRVDVKKERERERLIYTIEEKRDGVGGYTEW